MTVQRFRHQHAATVRRLMPLWPPPLSRALAGLTPETRCAGETWQWCGELRASAHLMCHLRSHQLAKDRPPVVPSPSCLQGPSAASLCSKGECRGGNPSKDGAEGFQFCSMGKCVPVTGITLSRDLGCVRHPLPTDSKQTWTFPCLVYLWR